MRLNDYQQKLQQAIQNYVGKVKKVSPQRQGDIQAIQRCITKAGDIPSLTMELIHYLRDMPTGGCITTGSSQLKNELVKVIVPAYRTMTIEKLAKENKEMKETINNMKTQISELSQLQTKMMANAVTHSPTSPATIPHLKPAENLNTVVLTMDEYQDLLQQLSMLSQKVATENLSLECKPYV